MIFLVTTSLCQDWVICAPAAFLGCGSRLSGSLSGIPHPRSVTRHNHGKTIPYHRKLIGQKFERCVALTSDQKKNHESPHIGLISDWYHELPRVVARISSRITTVIRVVGTIEETIAVLPSHSQFRRKNYLYLHLHGLVLETSIYHWQDQPGSRYSAVSYFSGTTKPHKPFRKRGEQRIFNTQGRSSFFFSQQKNIHPCGKYKIR